jgi:hypothetical protein
VFVIWIFESVVTLYFFLYLQAQVTDIKFSFPVQGSHSHWKNMRMK